MADLTIKTLAQKIFTSIRDSSAISSYCTTNFSGAKHSVYYGAREAKSPPDTEYPTFDIIPLGKDRGDADEMRHYTVRVEVAIKDSSKTEATTDPGGIDTVLYNGAEKVEALLDLAMTVIEAIDSELFFPGKVFEINAVEFFPVITGSLNLEITIPVVFGNYEPTIS